MATEVKPAAAAPTFNPNPFRTPAVTPNPTGTGTSPSTSASLPNPQSHPQSTSSAAPTQRSNSPRRGRPADDLVADLQGVALEDVGPAEPPPAYTPAANPYEGEATVEYGPQRPFQPAPPPPPLPQQFTGMSSPPQQPFYTGMPPGGPFLSPHPTGMPLLPNQTGGWGQYPTRRSPSNSSLASFGPPPRHPSIPPSNCRPPLQTHLSPAPPTMSEFARDFYTAGSSERRPSPVPSNASSDGVAEPEHFERVAPPRSPINSFSAPDGPPPSRFAPPNGQPPSPSPVSPSLHRPPNGPPPPSPSRVSSSNADEWKPTTTPTPGQSLLNKGRTLIYPSGFECRKCLNTGYKSFDPSHPCRKCWDKYGKLYSGALLYAPRTEQSQRPLPALRPPHIRHQHTQSQPSTPPQPAPPSNLGRSQSTYRPNCAPGSGYPGRPVSTPNTGLGPGGFVAPQRPVMMPTPQLSFTRGLPPPGTTVVRPGDARIGGRLCWRCDGRGSVSFFIFDVEQCPICNGLGRVFQ